MPAPPGSRKMSIGQLAVVKARQLANAATSLPYVKLLECRRTDSEFEAVVVDLEVERPQAPAHDVRAHETIAIIFPMSGQGAPDVLALRPDFPSVPHLNLRPVEIPRSLCIYEDAFAEFGFKWSPAGFLEDIRTWLSKTARGDLHAADQQLEPLLDAGAFDIVVPAGMLEGIDHGTPLFLRFSSERSERTLVVSERMAEPGNALMCAVYLVGQPQTHGVIRRRPSTIQDLHELLSAASIDLVSGLRAAVKVFIEGHPNSAERTYLGVFVDLPKTRSTGGAVESIDRMAFFAHATVGEFSSAMGLFEKVGQHYGAILGGSKTTASIDIPVTTFRRLERMSPALAAAFNGVAADSDRRVLVGAGALGSQVFGHTLRAGCGRWTVIDRDVYLPHNDARHMLVDAIGNFKADATAGVGNAIFSDGAVSSIVADVVFPLDKLEAINRAFETSTIVYDCAASVAVSRKLSRDYPGGRRISMFLNPSGTDLVMLAEPRDRSVRLDQLEFIYYRAVAQECSLDGHLLRPGPPLRYSNACRDRSNVLSQSNIGTLSGLAASAARQASSVNGSQITIWRVSIDLQVKRIDIHVPQTLTFRSGNWTVFTDSEMLRNIRDARVAKFPNETGGVLLGSFDLERQFVFISHMLGSPSDSKEWPTLYIRGRKDLKERVSDAALKTQRALEYVGEWHSHPKGYDSKMSGLDRKALATIAEQMAPDGRPGVMLIVGEDENFYVEMFESPPTKSRARVKKG